MRVSLTSVGECVDRSGWIWLFKTPTGKRTNVEFLFYPPTKLSTRVLQPQRSFFSCPKPIFPTQYIFVQYCPVLHSTVYSTVQYLGPCFGMNGHFRRDPDVRSRLPESTIDFLSVCIGFRCSNRIKMVVLNENTSYIRKNWKTSKFYFVKGIILDHFRHPKSIFWYPKLKILWKNV